MAERALALDDSIAEAHGVLGMYKLKDAWDWQGADAALRRALVLNPNDPMSHIWMAFSLSSQGRHDEALAHVKSARDLDRFSRTANLNVGLQHYEARQYAAAMRECDTTLELFPDFWGAYLGRGLAYSQQGDHHKALRDLQQAVAHAQGNYAAPGALGYGLAKCGEHDKAQQVLETLQARAVQEYVPPVTIMAIYAMLDDLDNAFLWLKPIRRARVGWRGSKWDTNLTPACGPALPGGLTAYGLGQLSALPAELTAGKRERVGVCCSRGMDQNDTPCKIRRYGHGKPY